MTSIASVTAPLPQVPVAQTTAAAAPAKPAPAAPSFGPAATVQLSQRALAKLKGDKDWQPGQKVDAA